MSTAYKYGVVLAVAVCAIFMTSLEADAQQ